MKFRSRIKLPEQVKLPQIRKPQQDHPEIKRVDPTRLDSRTRELYRDAREAADEAHELVADVDKGSGVAQLTRHPFQFGFVAALGVLTAILVGGLLEASGTILIYIAAALFIALGLDPMVRKLEKLGLNRGLAIAAVFVGLLAVLAGVLGIVVPILIDQVTQLVQNAPDFITSLIQQPWYQDLNRRVSEVVDLNQLLVAARDFVASPDNLTTVAGGVWSAGLGIANALTATMIVLILSLYFIASLRAMKLGFYKLTPRSKRARVIDITEQVTDSVGSYVAGQATIALLNAGCGFIMMSIIGVPYAAAVAVCVFLLALVPLVGALLATVMVSVVALFNSPTTALIALIYYLIYMQLEAYVITPRIMNRVVSVPGAFVVIGALTGGTLLGLLGALIAIPVTASIIMIVKQVWIPRQDER